MVTLVVRDGGLAAGIRQWQPLIGGKSKYFGVAQGALLKAKNGQTSGVLLIRKKSRLKTSALSHCGGRKKAQVSVHAGFSDSEGPLRRTPLSGRFCRPEKILGIALWLSIRAILGEGRALSHVLNSVLTSLRPTRIVSQRCRMGAGKTIGIGSQLQPIFQST